MTTVKRIETYCSNKNFKATDEGYQQRDLKLHLNLTYTVFVISELFVVVLSKCHFYPRTNKNGFKNNNCIVQEMMK